MNLMAELSVEDIEAIEGATTALEFLDQLNEAATPEYKSVVVEAIARLRAIVDWARAQYELEDAATPVVNFCPATGEQCAMCATGHCDWEDGS